METRDNCEQGCFVSSPHVLTVSPLDGLPLSLFSSTFYLSTSSLSDPVLGMEGSWKISSEPTGRIGTGALQFCRSSLLRRAVDPGLRGTGCAHQAHWSLGKKLQADDSRAFSCGLIGRGGTTYTKESRQYVP